MLINLFTLSTYSGKPPTGKLGKPKKKKKSNSLCTIWFAMGSKNLYARTYKEVEKFTEPCIFNFSWQRWMILQLPKVNVSKPVTVLITGITLQIPPLSRPCYPRGDSDLSAYRAAHFKLGFGFQENPQKGIKICYSYPNYNSDPL